MAENCLYLSVWSSQSILSETTTSVIVIINSGQEKYSCKLNLIHFFKGREENTEVDGIELADIGDVVVVMVESRHGALGFMAVEDEVTGNIIQVAKSK